jgi:hypothetical protein
MHPASTNAWSRHPNFVKDRRFIYPPWPCRLHVNGNVPAPLTKYLEVINDLPTGRLRHGLSSFNLPAMKHLYHEKWHLALLHGVII